MLDTASNEAQERRQAWEVKGDLEMMSDLRGVSLVTLKRLDEGYEVHVSLFLF